MSNECHKHVPGSPRSDGLCSQKAKACPSRSNVTFRVFKDVRYMKRLCFDILENAERFFIISIYVVPSDMEKGMDDRLIDKTTEEFQHGNDELHQNKHCAWDEPCGRMMITHDVPNVESAQIGPGIWITRSVGIRCGAILIRRNFHGQKLYSVHWMNTNETCNVHQTSFYISIIDNVCNRLQTYCYKYLFSPTQSVKTAAFGSYIYCGSARRILKKKKLISS